MSDEISIIIALSIIISLSPLIAKLSHIPAAPIEIIFGSIAGYLGFLVHIPLFDLVAKFGFLYLMFLAGMEVDLKKVVKIPRKILEKGVIYLVLLYLFSFFFSRILGLSAIFVVILPLISVGIIATLIREYGKEAPWLFLSMTIGSLGEVVSIGVLTLVSAGLEFGLGLKLYETIGYLVLFIASIAAIFKILRVLFWWYPDFKSVLMPRIDPLEQDIRISMAILFALIAVMLYLKLELAFGTFIAGLFVATFFEQREELHKKLTGFGFGFFVPIFFVYIGSSFKMEALMMDGLIAKALLITLLMIMVRILAASVFIRQTGFANAILFGLSHAMPLSLLIAVATLAYHSKSIDHFHYMAFILASLFEVIIVTTLIKLIVAFIAKRERVGKI